METTPSLTFMITLVTSVVTALTGVGIAVWKAGAKADPDFVMGNYHREVLKRISEERQRERQDANARLEDMTEQRDRLQAQNDRLLGVADVAVKERQRTRAASGADGRPVR